MKNLYSNIRKFSIVALSYLGGYATLAQNPYGNADISVPIYTLKEGNLTVPILLAYDASGVRVDAQASEVGLNWNLIAGGKITRIKRDKADETVRKFTDAAPGSVFRGYKTEGLPDVDGLATDNRFFYFRDLEPDLFTINVSGINAQFYLTNSGITKNGTNVVLVSQNQDMTIEFTENTTAPVFGPPQFSFPTNLDTWLYRWGGIRIPYYISFKVTLADGTIYYFGETENQREYSFTYNTYKSSNFLSATRRATASFNDDVERNAKEDILAVNAWNLSRIVRPKGALAGTDKYQQITFEYARRAMVLPAMAFREDYSDVFCSPPTEIRLNYQDSPILLRSQLQSIESSQFRVEFNPLQVKLLEGKVSNIKAVIPDYLDGSMANTNRDDISGVKNNVNFPSNIEIYDGGQIPAGYYPATDPLVQIPTFEALKHIIVYDKESANQKSLAFYFDYDYFIQNDDGKNSVFLTPERPKRLKLKGIYQLKFQRTNGIPTSAEILPGYTFVYDPRNLPSKLDTRRDHWGYFNGTTSASLSNGSLVTIGYPRNVSSMVENTTAFNCQIYWLRDMEAKEQHKTLGTLLRMNIPSGGYTEYSYGLHDCDNYFSEKQIVNSLPVKIGLKKVGGIRINQLNTFDPVTNSTYITRYSYTKKDNPNESSGFLSVWPNYTYCRMNKVVAGTAVAGITFLNTDGTKWVPDREYYAASQYTILQSQYVNGLPIMYRRVKVENIKIENGIEISNGYTEHEYNNNEQQPYMILQNGQMSFDVENSSVIGKCYDAYYYLGYRYPKFDLSRGTLKAVRIYKNGVLNPLQETLYDYTVTDYNTTPPFGFIPIGAAAIAPPYDVKFRDNRRAGKIIGRVVIGAGLAYAGSAVTQLGTISSVLNATGSSSNFLSPLKELTPFNILVTIFDALLGTRIEDRSNYSIDKFKPPVGKLILNSVTNRSYDQNGLNPNETTTSYVYGSSNHSQITKTTTNHKPTPTSAITEQVEQNIIYSPDFVTTTATGSDLLGIKRLQERKIIVPIESYTKRNTRVIGGSYIEFNSTESLVGLPTKTFQLELATPTTTFTPASVNAGTITKNNNYVLKSTFSEYSALGLPIRFNATDAPESKIVYGIDGQSFLPSEVITAFGSTLSRSTKLEHIPLFGTSKITGSDNTFTTTEYDEIGRVKAVKDLDGNIRKSYNYNYAEKALASRTFSVSLDVTNNNSLVTTKTLLDLDTYTASSGDNLVLGVQVNQTVGSLVMVLDNPYYWERKILNNWTSVPTGVNGFSAFKPGITGQGTEKIGLVNFTITAYSLPDGKGDIIGVRRIQLTIN